MTVATESLPNATSPPLKEKKKFRRKITKPVSNKVLHPYITTLWALYTEQSIKDYEFIGAYLLLFAQHYHNGSWRGGKLNPKARERIPSLIEFYNQHPSGGSLLLDDIPGLMVTENDKKSVVHLLQEFLQQEIIQEEVADEEIIQRLSKLKDTKEVTLLEFFFVGSLLSFQPLVNSTICNWSIGQRPYVVKDFIPSAEVVLDMQTEGKRVLTVFVKEEEMDQIWKDSYPPYAEHGPLEFLVHDLQHMEKFVQKEFYMEQIGFFKCMKAIPCGFFDAMYKNFCLKEFLADLDHVRSDMNACCVHLLAFLKAKWMYAEYKYYCQQNDIKVEVMGRLTTKQQKQWEQERFKKLLDVWGVPEDVCGSMHQVCHKMTKEQSTQLKNYFIEMAHQ